MERSKIIEKVSNTLKISKGQVNKTLELIEEGNTVPFIARYRKEVTGNLDEDQIQEVFKEYDYFKKLEEKKENTLKKIEEKGMLTPEIIKEIEKAQKMSEIDDIYLPFKEKKKTKATQAIAAGLEPLALYIKAQKDDYLEEAQKYLCEGFEDVQKIVEGAKYIIAENISDNSQYRKMLREDIYQRGMLTTKIKKNGKEIDEKEKYSNYYEFSQNIKKIPGYRVLAINRAEKEKVLTVNITYDEEYILNKVLKKEVNYKEGTPNEAIIASCIKDAYKRLILPSITREIRRELKDRADIGAIKIFTNNFEKLIMQKPLKNKWILSLDPAFRTGCKYAVVNNMALMEEIGVIYPHEPVNKIKEAKEKIFELLEKYPIEQIVIGNGTASRETEKFIKDINIKIKYNLISEAGASVYSASKVAQEEFPDLKVEYRSAISIARRIQDPMAELVKIDAKSIGVGQYQHDVDQTELSSSLDFTTEKVVNQVGVDLNTSSKELLTYVSGLDKGLAKNIIEYKKENGDFKNRKQLLEVKRLGKKAYEQCAGFLKVLGGEDYLDETFIHPEDYKVTKNLIKEYENIKNKDFKLTDEEKEKFIEKNNISKAKLDELINYLQKPNLDIRDEIVTAEFKSDIQTIEDLVVGDQIQGEVRNILEFGAFVDIGLKNDALIHISEISNTFVKDVSNFLQVGDILEFRVKEVNLKNSKIQLSLKDMG